MCWFNILIVQLAPSLSLQLQHVADRSMSTGRVLFRNLAVPCTGRG